MSELVMLAGAEEAKESHVGYIVLDYLKESIDSWNETVTFRDQVVQPEVARRCFLLLLKIEGTGLTQKQRRTRVIRLLKAYCSKVTWRKEGPEREFVALLAKHMIDRRESEAA